MQPLRRRDAYRGAPWVLTARSLGAAYAPKPRPGPKPSPGLGLVGPTARARNLVSREPPKPSQSRGFQAEPSRGNTRDYSPSNLRIWNKVLQPTATSHFPI
jgi:hypothetical protein